MTSEFVYIKLTFNALLLTKGSSSSVSVLGYELALRPKVVILSSNFKDTFRMIVSMIVSNFVEICQVTQPSTLCGIVK